MSTDFMALPAAAPASYSARILVLDDERMIGKILAEMLTLHGHAPTVCTSAKQALDLIAHVEFDLILSDYCMPLMNGQEFFHAAVQARPALARRIIFLTGDDFRDETRAFLETANTPYLVKPFHFPALEHLVNRVLLENQRRGGLENTPERALSLCA